MCDRGGSCTGRGAGLPNDKEVVEIDIESVRKKYEEQLMEMANVVAVGIGEKAGKEVIMVFVTVKIPESDLQAGELVPKELEGYETDVEAIGTVSAQT